MNVVIPKVTKNPLDLLVSGAHAGSKQPQNHALPKEPKNPAGAKRAKKMRSSSRPLPPEAAEGLREINRLAKKVLAIQGWPEFSSVLTPELGKQYVLAKVKLVRGLLGDRLDMKSFTAFSRLSLLEDKDLYADIGKSKLSQDALVSLLASIEALQRPNDGYLQAAARRALTPSDKLNEYVGRVVIWELAVHSLRLFVQDKAKPKVRDWPEALAHQCLAWAKELEQLACELGFFAGDIQTKFVLTNQSAQELTELLKRSGEPTSELRQLMTSDGD